MHHQSNRLAGLNGRYFRFRYLQYGVLLGALLSGPIIALQPAVAYLSLPWFDLSVSQSQPSDLKTAIALLLQAQYTDADAILRPLIQAHPSDMAVRDYYFLSQTLQENWLNVAMEYGDRAYLNLPNIGYATDRMEIATARLDIPEELRDRLRALNWSAPRQLDGAIASIQRQLTSDPTAIAPHLTLASLYNMAGQPAQAQAQLQELVRRHPTDAQLQLILAQNQLPSPAKTTAFLASLQLNPQLVAAWIAYAQDRAATDRPGAIQIYRDACQANPTSYELHYLLGQALVQNQQIAEAIAPLRRSTELQPKFSNSWRLLLSALQTLQDPDQSIAVYQRLAELNPEFSEFNSQEFNLLMLRKNRLADAVALFDRLSSTNPAIAAQGYFTLGSLLSNLAPSRGAQILQLHRRAYRLMPSDRNVLRAFATSAILYGDPARGEALLRQFLAQEPPESAQYATGELALAMAKQDIDRALAYLDQVTASDKDSAMGGYSWIASWLVEQQRWDEARVFYERASQHDPWYNIFLAQVMDEQGQTEAAIAKLRGVLDRIPADDINRRVPAFALGDILAKRGQVEAAIALYQDIVQQMPNPDSYFAFGELLRRYQRGERAIAQYRLALNGAAAQQDKLLMAKSHRGIGQVLQEQGQAAAATVELERAKALFQEQGCLDWVVETEQDIGRSEYPSSSTTGQGVGNQAKRMILAP